MGGILYVSGESVRGKNWFQEQSQGIKARRNHSIWEPNLYHIIQAQHLKKVIEELFLYEHTSEGTLDLQQFISLD